MPQINFVLIFVFGLAMVMFTLENTAATTVRFLPGMSTTMPLAVLLLVVGGVGATSPLANKAKRSKCRSKSCSKTWSVIAPPWMPSSACCQLLARAALGWLKRAKPVTFSPLHARNACDPGRGQWDTFSHPAAPRRSRAGRH